MTNNKNRINVLPNNNIMVWKIQRLNRTLIEPAVIDEDHFAVFVSFLLLWTGWGWRFACFFEIDVRFKADKSVKEGILLATL